MENKKKKLKSYIKHGCRSSSKFIQLSLASSSFDAVDVIGHNASRLQHTRPYTDSDSKVKLSAFCSMHRAYFHSFKLERNDGIKMIQFYMSM